MSRTESELKTLLVALDQELGDPFQWHPDALAAMTHWVEQTRIWALEGLMAADDPDEVDDV